MILLRQYIKGYTMDHTLMLDFEDFLDYAGINRGMCAVSIKGEKVSFVHPAIQSLWQAYKSNRVSNSALFSRAKKVALAL